MRCRLARLRWFLLRRGPEWDGHMWMSHLGLRYCFRCHKTEIPDGA